MDIVHQIVLAKETWDNFAKGLTNIDSGKQKKIQSFFEQISHTISIQREPNSIVVESSRLDEDAILAALCGGTLSRCDMQFYDCIDANDFIAYVTNAEDKTYHSKSPVTTSSEKEYPVADTLESALAA